VKLTDTELDILLDVVATHLGRVDDGLEPAADPNDLQDLLNKLSNEWDSRDTTPAQVTHATGEPQLVDPYDLSDYNAMGDN
jgi:hypothetical protein